MRGPGLHVAAPFLILRSSFSYFESLRFPWRCCHVNQSRRNPVRHARMALIVRTVPVCGRRADALRTSVRTPCGARALGAAGDLARYGGPARALVRTADMGF